MGKENYARYPKKSLQKQWLPRTEINSIVTLIFSQSIANSEQDFEKYINKETTGHLKPKTSRHEIKHIKNKLIYNICKRIMAMA